MNNRPLYIFDLDGTISLPDHRRHLVEKPNPVPRGVEWKPQWDAFYKACAVDAPNLPVIGVLLQLYQIGADIRIWSGREDSVRDITVPWIVTHLYLQPHVAEAMLERMRPTGDYTPDHVLKRKWLHAMAPVDRQRLAGVFDDRQKVVDMWRSEGLTCFQVAPGNF